MGFDVLKNPVLNDILTPYGFIYATAMVMSLDQRTGVRLACNCMQQLGLDVS